METGDLDGDEMLLGRLHEATAGDAAVRQLRRRYDALRQDYEQLLDRIGELEDVLSSRAREAQQAATEPALPPPAVRQPLAEAVEAPLLNLREEYLAAASRIQSIVTGIDRLSAGALKGQHTAEPEAPAAEAAPHADEAPEAPQNHRPRKVNLNVHGSGFGELLDFQEKLSTVAGVARVSISAIDQERATLLVELEPPAAE